ncbi:MAG TPA: hypothetical protein VMB05_12575 [Solirubrobacteraceae bacterium]|nr:hypothetical protein [Solirubrobacteraceae bacterium]
MTTPSWWNGRVKVSYANVVATIALFVSLGGVSYAVTSLPANSVGGRQLKPRAVGPGALSFPLGVVGTTITKPEDLGKGACNGALRPGEIPPPCAPPIFGYTGNREVELHLRRSGQLYVSAVVGLKNKGESGTHADVAVGIVVNRHVITRTGVTSLGGQAVQVPLQAIVHASAGKQTVGIAIEAAYHSYAPGDVIVTPVSIIAGAMPAT